MNRKIYLLIAGILLISSGCGKRQQPAVSEQAVLNLANAYYNNGLYQAAAQEYLYYIDHYPLDENRQANTYFTVANIYFERVKDYNKALEYYLKIKYLYPQSNLQKEVGKRIVNCLERLERSADAQRLVEKEAALDKSQVKENRPGAVVAQIGSKKITLGDLEFEISQLPAYLQQEFQKPDKKREFLKQLVLQDLLYDSAKRQGLDKDKEVIDGAFRAKKSLMVEKLLRQEMQKQVKITPEDVQLYYQAHKDRYVEKDKQGKVVRQKSFDEVQQQVAQDLAADRQQQAYQKLADRLLQAEDVQLYPDRIQ